MGASRALRLTVIALATLIGSSAFAGSPSLVVDLESGRVLHAERATDPWFPASITKLMTTYVALDMARSGQIRMDQLLTVSEASASLPPSKMAFKPGTQIRLDNALKIIMVKSANDVAATIAENLGGSIDGFADLMNRKAREIGMRESHFVNPHGLPDERNQTSARDMAILARALLTQFPEYSDLFHIGAIQYGRRIMRNTNGLIGRYPGADGMKTGFICSAGFNVVASATRNGRHLVTVVLGSPSANERTMKAAELFDRGFNTSPSLLGYTLDNLPMSASISPPDMRSVICDRRGPMPEEDSQTTVADSASTPNLLNSDVFAFTGNSAQPMRTTLGPRAVVEPVQVWVGLNPPSAADLAAQAAAEEAADKARQAKKAKKVANKPADKAASDKAAGDKSAEDKAADDKSADKKSAAKADDSSADEPVKKKGRASVSLKPVSDGAKKADVKPNSKKPQAAKAQTAADAKAAPKRPAPQKPKTKDASDNS